MLALSLENFFQKSQQSTKKNAQYDQFKLVCNCNDKRWCLKLHIVTDIKVFKPHIVTDIKVTRR